MNLAPRRFISTFTASRILKIPAMGVERLAVEGKLKKHQINKYIEKFDLDEVQALADELARGIPIDPPKSATDPAAPPPAQAPGVAAATAGGSESGINAHVTSPPLRYQIAAKNILMNQRIERELRSGEVIPVEQGLASFYKECPLYVKGGSDSLILYKPAGQNLSPSSGAMFPELFLMSEDRIKGSLELQAGLNEQFKMYLKRKRGGLAGVSLVKLVNLSMSEPAGEILDGLKETVEIMAGEVSQNQGMISELLNELGRHVSLTLHSSRVMAFVMRFCIKNGYSARDTKLLSLSALLHDIGKTQLPSELLDSAQQLSEEQQTMVQAHPFIGYELLEETGIQEEVIKYGVVEHHERLDGSGYPNGARKMSTLGQLLGIVDAYDMLRNTPKSGQALPTPIEALTALRKECEMRKLNGQLFESFAYSLV